MKRLLFLSFFLFYAFSTSSMELVVFTSEKTLVAEKIEFQDKLIILYLPGGNKMGCPKDLILKSYSGYVPPLDEKEPEKNLPKEIPYRDIIAKACQKEGLDLKLVAALIKVESNFNPYAVSPKGAKGLMQLMPSVQKDYKVKNAFDPEENIFAGVKYLKRLIDECSGDLGLALAAYNAGLKRVKEAEGLPEISETKNYVAKILTIYPTF